MGESVVDQAFSHELDPDGQKQIEEAESRLFSLASQGNIEGGFKPFGDAAQQTVEMAGMAIKRENKLAGISTGLIDLDRQLGGLQKSDLIIIAGRPSMGKTALVTNIASQAAENGQAVGFFSLEMSREQLATRILSQKINKSSEEIRRGQMNVEEFDRLFEEASSLKNLPLYIDDSAAITVAQVRTRARRLSRQLKGNLQLVVVDYLQLLRGNGRTENRVNEISEITQGLKAIAKELNVPVVALSQLSRAVEQRTNRRPQLADLRDSGTIEQDADIVLFVYREQYYHEREEPDPENEKEHDKWKQKGERIHNFAELILGKHRHGAIGTVVVHFRGETTNFANAELADINNYRKSTLSES